MKQLSLGFAASVDPDSPREERMGAVERDHWGEEIGESGISWHREGAGWTGAGEAGDLPLLVGVDEAGRGPLAGPVAVGAVLLSPAALEEMAEGSSWAGRIDDSKRLEASVREELFHEVMEQAVSWAIVHVHADHIDRVNILQATFHGMALATELILGVSGKRGEWPERPGLRARRFEDEGEDVSACWYAEDLCEEEGPCGADALFSPLAGEPADSARLLVDGHKPFDVAGAWVASLSQYPVTKGDALSIHIAAASVLAKVSRDQMMKISGELWPGYGFASHKGYPTASHRRSVKERGSAPIHRLSFKGASP